MSRRFSQPASFARAQWLLINPLTKQGSDHELDRITSSSLRTSPRDCRSHRLRRRGHLRWQQACVQAANTLTPLPTGHLSTCVWSACARAWNWRREGAVSLPEDGQDLGAVVRSGSNLYQIDTRLLICTCADYQKHLQACKHLLATEVHLGALGLVAPATPEPPATAAEEEPAAAVSAPGGASEPPVAPTTANWPTSEAPASLNIKLKVRNLELMYTMRDVDDLKLQRRATMSLPWLQDILHGCEANLAARQREAEEERKVRQRSLDERDRRGRRGCHKRRPPRAPRGMARATRPTHIRQDRL